MRLERKEATAGEPLSLVPPTDSNQHVHTTRASTCCVSIHHGAGEGHSSHSTRVVNLPLRTLEWLRASANKEAGCGSSWMPWPATMRQRPVEGGDPPGPSLWLGVILGRAREPAAQELAKHDVRGSRWSSSTPKMSSRCTSIPLRRSPEGRCVGGRGHAPLGDARAMPLSRRQLGRGVSQRAGRSGADRSESRNSRRHLDGVAALCTGIRSCWIRANADAKT